MVPINLADFHCVQAQRLGPRIALRFKQHGLYRDMSWAESFKLAQACAAGLISVGVKPGDRVGILAENRSEWLLADLGILAAAAVNVPLHAPLTTRQIHFQLADSGVRWLFVSTRQQLDKVRQIRDELPDLEGIVVFDRVDGEHSWDGFLQRGRQAGLQEELLSRRAAMHGETLATVMYTSGTTGNPKGVMLTHGNLISNVVAVDESSPRGPETVVLNWLPLSHIYARTLDHYLSLIAGLTLCLAESPETVVANLGEVQPTLVSSVPRFYEKVLSAVACDDLARTGRRLRDIFGPNIDWLSSGGAPLPVAIAEAYRDAGLMVLQGYGLTESSPVISFNHKGAYKLETVGRPIPGVEVRIAPDGEVLTRGPHVMKGYWNNPAATAEAIKDGWLHTGDLGQLDDDGFLSITGRKKELLVMSNGKKIVPNYLEGLLLGDPCIDQVVIHGEGHNFLTALVVPNWTNLRQALAAEGSANGQADEELALADVVYGLLTRRMEQRLADVSACEQIRKFVVLAKPFTVAAEELTVSLKLRRKVVLEKYRDALEALYDE